MANGNTPGDGQSNPFGDGTGGAEASGMAQGNNFLTNPRGNPAAGPTPPDFLDASRPTRAAGQRTNSSDAAPGGLIPKAPPSPAQPGGVGTVGNPNKPYRLGG